MGSPPHPPKGSRGMTSHSAYSKVSSIFEISTSEQNLPCCFSQSAHEVLELKGSGRMCRAVTTACAGCEFRAVLYISNQPFLDDLISLTTRKRAGFSWYDHIRTCVCGSGSSVFSAWSISWSIHCKLRVCCLFALSEQRKGLDSLGVVALHKQSMFLEEEMDLF